MELCQKAAKHLSSDKTGWLLLVEVLNQKGSNMRSYLNITIQRQAWQNVEGYIISLLKDKSVFWEVLTRMISLWLGFSLATSNWFLHYLLSIPVVTLENISSHDAALSTEFLNIMLLFETIRVFFFFECLLQIASENSWNFE